MIYRDHYQSICDRQLDLLIAGDVYRRRKDLCPKNAKSVNRLNPLIERPKQLIGYYDYSTWLTLSFASYATTLHIHDSHQALNGHTGVTIEPFTGMQIEALVLEIEALNGHTGVAIEPPVHGHQD